MRLLSNLLGKFVQNGTLHLTDAGGRVHVFGAKRPGPSIAIRLHDPRLHFKLFVNPELYAGEGRWTSYPLSSLDRAV
jgi:cyclopropane-fatty-acyl-phospholipid synthase